MLILPAFSILVGFGSVSKSAAAGPIVDEIDWPTMLASHDMLWGKLPSKWFEAPFLGNGEQGTMMYQLDRKTLRWDVGCSAAHDHRPADDDDLSEKHVEVLNRGRHIIGHLRLELPVSLTGGQSRLSLWNAEATGTLSSAGGSAHWTTLVHATEPVMRFELTASGDLTGADFSYVAEQARSPRAVRAGTLRNPKNPPPVLSKLPDGVNTTVHHLGAGGQTAVAWMQEDAAGTKRLWLSVQHSFPGNEATNLAVAAVRAAAATDQADWRQAHRAWWHAYYPASFISTGDAYWDAFYWIQQYKLACVTRDKGWVIDNPFSGGACIAAMLGDGDRALDFMNRFKSYLKPSTLYSEIGLPVMETPIHGAAAMQEMLLQSWGGRLRVFPAVASEWTDVCFHQLRGEGAYLVSASRVQGASKWVVIESTKGGVVEVEPRLLGAQWSTSPGVTVNAVSPGVYRIITQPGDWAMFSPKGEVQASPVIKPVKRRGNPYHFGLPKGYDKSTKS